MKVLHDFDFENSFAHSADGIEEKVSNKQLCGGLIYSTTLTENQRDIIHGDITQAVPLGQ